MCYIHNICICFNYIYIYIYLYIHMYISFDYISLYLHHFHLTGPFFFAARSFQVTPDRASYASCPTWTSQGPSSIRRRWPNERRVVVSWRVVVSRKKPSKTTTLIRRFLVCVCIYGMIQVTSYIYIYMLYVTLEISSTKQGWHMPCTNHFFPMVFVQNQGDANAYFVVKPYVL